MFRVEPNEGKGRIYYLIFEQWLVIDKIKLRYFTYKQMMDDLCYNPDDDELGFMQNYNYVTLTIIINREYLL